MNDSSSLHSDSEANTETLLSTDSEPVKKPPTRKIARKRPTHVRLQNRGLRTIPNMESSKDIFVLYLYNNKINSISNLEVLKKLTHLYLTHNNIRRLENLTGLVSLEKLYIGHNRISVLEGLEGLHRLRELHAESQRLPAGDTMTFDPRSVQAIRGTLHVLKIDNNAVTSLKPLAPLPYLTELCCAGNQLSSLVDLTDTLRQMPSLAKLELKGNPVCQLQRHRDAVVETAPELTKFDELDVTPAFRQFVLGRGHALARRMSSTQHLRQPLMTSHSDDVIVRDASEAAGLRPPQVALSQGSIVHPRKTQAAPVQPRQASSSHVRVGNMLTLTPTQRALVRTSRTQSDAQLESSSGDQAQPDFPGGDLIPPPNWPRQGDTLPNTPARRPIGSDHRSARPSTSQQHAMAEPPIGDLRQLVAWPSASGERKMSGEAGLLRQTVSEELPSRMNMLAIMP